MENVYPSRVDRWLVVVLIGVPLGLLGYGAFLSVAEPGTGLALVIVALLTGILMLVCTIPCVYRLSDQRLHIRSGMLIDVDLPLEDVSSAEACSSLLAGPALSLRRVKVKMRRGNLWIISPRDRDAFLRDIHARMKTLRSKDEAGH